jgi:cyclic nucleotide-binding protein
VEVPRQIDDKERTIRTLGEGDLLGEVALFRHGRQSATVVAVEHEILLAIRAPRLEQIVRTNPELVTLIRQLARMGAHDDKCIEAVALGSYRPLGKPFVRRPELVDSQEPGGVDASPSS